MKRIIKEMYRDTCKSHILTVMHHNFKVINIRHQEIGKFHRQKHKRQEVQAVNRTYSQYSTLGEEVHLLKI